MNTLTHPATPPAPPHPALNRAMTWIALALDVPDQGEHRVDLAALVLRPDDGTTRRSGRLRCALHAGMPAALIAAQVDLPVEQVTGCSPVQVALTVLDRHLTTPPYTLIGYDTAHPRTLIDRYREACPNLACAAVLDLATLASHGDEVVGLEAWALELGVTVGPWTDGALREARLIGAVHDRLSAAAATGGGGAGCLSSGAHR